MASSWYKARCKEPKIPLTPGNLTRTPETPCSEPLGLDIGNLWILRTPETSKNLCTELVIRNLYI